MRVFIIWSKVIILWAVDTIAKRNESTVKVDI